MNPAAKVLRLAFVLAAITDGLALLPMLSPRLATWLLGADPDMMTVGYRYAMGMAASLMAGWTVLLLWGALRPLERKAILVMTMVPVVFGLLLSLLQAVAAGLLLPERVLILVAHLGFVMSLMLYGLHLSRARPGPPC